MYYQSILSQRGLISTLKKLFSFISVGFVISASNPRVSEQSLDYEIAVPQEVKIGFVDEDILITWKDITCEACGADSEIMYVIILDASPGAEDVREGLVEPLTRIRYQEIFDDAQNGVGLNEQAVVYTGYEMRYFSNLTASNEYIVTIWAYDRVSDKSSKGVVKSLMRDELKRRSDRWVIPVVIGVPSAVLIGGGFAIYRFSLRRNSLDPEQVDDVIVGNNNQDHPGSEATSEPSPDEASVDDELSVENNNDFVVYDKVEDTVYPRDADGEIHFVIDNPELEMPVIRSPYDEGGFVANQEVERIILRGRQAMTVEIKSDCE